MRLLLTIPVATLVALLLHADTSRIYACSCAPPRPPLEALVRADKVFSGEVVSMRLAFPSSHQGGSWSSTDPILVEFLVSEVWKGQPYETMFVTTRRSGASCGFDFVLGQRYLVYADEENMAWLCNRTKSLRYADEDFDALGKGTEPTPGTSELRPEFRENWLWRNLTAKPTCLFAQLFGLGLLGVLAWIVLRRRSGW